MKQKLGLACSLVRSPDLLILDEPTVGVDPLSRRELWEIISQLVNEQGLAVLVSTSYLDEAERCGHAIVLHEGKVLTQGPPAEVNALAEGRTFIADSPAGKAARTLQAQLLDDPQIVDAVPEAGRVRFVVGRRGENGEASGRPGAARTAAPQLDALAQVAVSPASPRFEDGFMVLLRKSHAARDMAGSMTIGQPPPQHAGGCAVEVRD